MIKNSIKKAKHLSLSAIVGMSVLFSTSAFAQQMNLTELTKNIDNSTTLFGTITSYVCYLMGGIIGVLGILTWFKSQKNPNDPSATPLKGLMMFLIGGALFLVPTLLGVATSTIGGDSETDGYTNVRFGK